MPRKLPDEWRDLLALIPGYDSEATAEEGDWFDVDAAQRALDFFPDLLQFVEGERAGEPFVLEAWQKAVTAALFGWKRADGTRRYRECLYYVPRKSGKTSWVAGIACLVLYTDNEDAAQCFVAGTDKGQSSLVFRHVAMMVEREPLLRNRSRIYRTTKTIEYGDSTFKALAGDAHALHGLNGHLVILDELHSYKNRDLVDVLLTSTASRTQPIVIYTTTADFDRISIANEKHDYAGKVRDGLIRDHAFLPVIYEAAKDDDWTSQDTWRKSNPNLGVSISLDYLARECERAKAQPSYEATFRRLHLNQKTQNQTVWLRLSDWDACQRELIDLAGRECYGGLDLSTTTDLSSFVLAFPVDDLLWIIPHFWIPERKLEDKTDRLDYGLYKGLGLITVTEGDVVDYDKIRADIRALGEKYNIREIRLDRWNANQISTQLTQDGFRMTGFGQGMQSMNAPSKEFERRVVGHTIAHAGHPIMRQHIAATMVKLDPAGNIKPDKSKTTGSRIDGTVAAIMATSGAMTSLGPSVYESRGVLVL